MSEGRFTSNRQNDGTRANYKYFESVIESYRQFREYAPLVACNHDPTARSKKLVPTIIHFLADVDMATKQVLKSDGHLRLWNAIVDEQAVNAKAASSIAQRCGRIYRVRGLAPYEYFRVITKPVQRSIAA